MSESTENGTLVPSSFTYDLSAPPSCVEFSPSIRHIFVVGTYSLLEHDAVKIADESPIDKGETKEQHRSGSLLLFQLDTDLSVSCINSYDIASAVLDIHFSIAKESVLATATSGGAIYLHILDEAGSKLDGYRVIQAFDASTLVLSLAWNPDPNHFFEIAATLSTGEVALVETQTAVSESRPSPRLFEAHSLEAWTASWSTFSGRLFSGGDDSVIRSWYPRFNENKSDSFKERLPADEELEKRLHKGPPLISIPGTLNDLRTHTAGITAILPLDLGRENSEEFVVTGSYDEFVRVLSPCTGRAWKCMAEARLGGGVWRLKLMHSMGDDQGYKAVVLATCMHAGPRVVEIIRNKSDWIIKIVARLEEHESMNYGSDFVKSDREGKPIIISTSFYDRKLCVWECPISIPL